MGRGFNIPWVGGQNTMDRRLDIPWVGGLIYTMDRGFYIPWIEVSIYDGYGDLIYHG